MDPKVLSDWLFNHQFSDGFRDCDELADVLLAEFILIRRANV